MDHKLYFYTICFGVKIIQTVLPFIFPYKMIYLFHEINSSAVTCVSKVHKPRTHNYNFMKKAKNLQICNLKKSLYQLITHDNQI